MSDRRPRADRRHIVHGSQEDYPRVYQWGSRSASDEPCAGDLGPLAADEQPDDKDTTRVGAANPRIDVSASATSTRWATWTRRVHVQARRNRRRLDSLSPGTTPDIDGARAALGDFGRLWDERTIQPSAASWSHSSSTAFGSTTSASWRFAPRPRSSCILPAIGTPPPLVRQG